VSELFPEDVADDVGETGRQAEVAEPADLTGPAELTEGTDLGVPAEFTEGVGDAIAGAGLEDFSPSSGLAELVDPRRLRAAIEAVLFIVESPVSAAQLATVVERPTAEVEAALSELAASYDDGSRGIELRWIADGVRIYTRPEFTGVVEAFVLEGQRTKLSQAALETLAVIAYRQPVTRGRVAAIRGVNVDGVVRTLSGRGLIVEVGADPDTGGGLFRTTDAFLEKMGLQSLDELPSLAPLLPEIDSLDTDEL
jgi:segregation and condensation protein B